MPISKYNPDGTVDIYNKKTGEVKSGVQPSQLGIISPKLVAEYQAGQAPEQVLARKEAELKLKDLEKPTGEGTVEQQFKTKQALRAVGELEGLYGRGNAANVGTGQDLSLAGSATVLGKTGAKVNALGRSVFDSKYQEDVNKFQAQLQQSVGILTQAFGSGTPQEGEAKRLIASAPSPTSTNEEAKQWFTSARKLLGQMGQDTSLPATPPDLSEKKRNPLVNFFLGSSLDYAKDIGAGVGLSGKTGDDMRASQDQAIEMANKVFDRARVETDPEQKKRLEQVGKQVLEQVGFNAENTQKLFSESINKPNLQRGAEVAGEVATLAELPSLIKGGVNLVKGGLPKTPPPLGNAVVEEGLSKTPNTLGNAVVKVGEKIEQSTPKSILGRKQAEAAAKLQGVTPVIDNFINTGKKLATQDPDVAREFAKQEPYIKEIKDIPTLLDRMQSWGRTAYLRSGGIKASAKADLFDGLYQEGLEQLKVLAPEVYKYRSLLRFSYELPKEAGKMLWKATLGRFAFGL